jgi:predicted transcriptional regulator
MLSVLLTAGKVMHCVQLISCFFGLSGCALSGAQG